MDNLPIINIGQYKNCTCDDVCTGFMPPDAAMDDQGADMIDFFSKPDRFLP